MLLQLQRDGNKMHRTFDEIPFFEVHAFSHYFSEALENVAFKSLDEAFDLALSIASMDSEFFKTIFMSLEKMDRHEVLKFIESLDEPAMVALNFIIKTAEIEPYLLYWEKENG